VISDQEFDFVFSNGMAEQVSTEYPNPNLQHQLEFLKTTYGPPTLADTVVYQNPYGPDGLRARLMEHAGWGRGFCAGVHQICGRRAVHWLTVTSFRENGDKGRLRRATTQIRTVAEQVRLYQRAFRAPLRKRDLRRENTRLPAEKVTADAFSSPREP